MSVAILIDCIHTQSQDNDVSKTMSGFRRSLFISRHSTNHYEMAHIATKCTAATSTLGAAECHCLH